MSSLSNRDTIPARVRYAWPMREGGGIATGIGVAVFFYLLLLPLLLVVFLYAFFSIYAMTKGTAFGAATINLPVWFAGVAVITALLVSLLMGVVSRVGRSLHASRRRREA
jgi:glycerol-3-phosphate acyltransferase PlsY